MTQAPWLLGRQLVAEGGPTSASPVAGHDPAPGSATPVRQLVAEGGPTSASPVAGHDPEPYFAKASQGKPGSATFSRGRGRPAHGCAALLPAVILLAVSGARANEAAFGPATDALRASHATAMKGQTAADMRQAEAQMRLGFVAERARQVLELQQAAREAQATANRAQSEVGRVLADASFRAWEIERLQSTWHANLRRSDEAGTAWVAADAAAREAQERAQAALLDAEAREAAAAADGAPRSARQQATEARRKADTAARDAARRRQDASRLLADQQRFRANAMAAWPGLAERWQTVRQLRVGALADAVAAARDAQDAAHTAQETAADALRRLLEEAPEPAQEDDAQAHPSDRSDPSDPSDAPALPSSPGELHALATATESRITARYVETRAAELAVIRSVPLATARASVDPPAPARSDTDTAALGADAATVDAIEAYRSNLAKTLEDVEAMVTRGQHLLAAVGATADTHTGEVTVVPTAADAGVAEALEGLATDDANEPAKDLADLMDAAYAATEASGGPEAAHGAEGGGARPRAGVGHSSDAGGSGRPDPMPGARRGAWQKPLNPYDGTATGLPPRPRPVVSPGEYTDTPALFAALPGRRVQAEGVPGAAWMYVDSWYVIGPFPNPDRRYLEREFPPDAVVDLDAVYEGADGQPVRWQFIQTGDPVVRVTESYSIYYAYAELWFDEPRTLWVALGSDDGSRLFLNDLLIWKTVAAKPWRINEAYRRVSFKKGRNRILYRVENGPAHGWFSFLLHVQPPAQDSP